MKLPICQNLKPHTFCVLLECRSFKGNIKQIIFAVAPCILILSILFIYPTDAQLDCSKRMSKFALNLHLNSPTCFGLTTIIRELIFVALLKL